MTFPDRNTPLDPQERQSAYWLAETVLTSGPPSTRALARYVLRLLGSVGLDGDASAVQEQPFGACAFCGSEYPGLTLRAATEAHAAGAVPHPFSPKMGPGHLVVTETTLREQERPSGEADRDQTGANDRYSNQ